MEFHYYFVFKAENVEISRSDRQFFLFSGFYLNIWDTSSNLLVLCVAAPKPVPLRNQF